MAASGNVLLRWCVEFEHTFTPYTLFLSLSLSRSSKMYEEKNIFQSPKEHKVLSFKPEKEIESREREMEKKRMKENTKLDIGVIMRRRL